MIFGNQIYKPTTDKQLLLLALNFSNHSPLTSTDRTNATFFNRPYIESFNGKLRDELLNTEIFFSLPEAREKLEQHRLDYNTMRPHPNPRSSHYHWPREREQVKPAQTNNLGGPVWVTRPTGLS